MNPEITLHAPSFGSQFANLNREFTQRAIESQCRKKTSLLAKIKNRKTILTPIKPQEKMLPPAKLSLDLARWRETQFELPYFSQLVEDLYSSEKIKQYRGIIGIRRFLSIDNPNIQPVVDAKLVPRVIEFLRMEDEPEMQIEAAWLLTNVASGTTEQLKEVMNKGAVPAFIKILHSQNKDLREQAMWAFGNICGDSASNRDIVLKHGGLPPLLTAINHPEANKYTLMRGAWALSNMCRGRPLPSLSYTLEAIPTFCGILSTQTDEEILQDAAWALSYLTRHKSKTDSVISEQPFIGKLIDLLDNSYLSVVIPCLCIIKNLACKNPTHAQVFLNFPKFLPKICDLLGHRKRSVQKEVIFLLSDLILTSTESIQRLTSDLSFIPRFVAVIDKHRETQVYLEALKAISHLLQTIGPNVLKSVSTEDILGLFVNAFENDSDSDFLLSSLEVFEIILQLSTTLTSEDPLHISCILTSLQEKGVLDDLTRLQQQTRDREVYERLMQLVTLYIPNIELIPRSLSSSESEESGESGGSGGSDSDL